MDQDKTNDKGQNFVSTRSLLNQPKEDITSIKNPIIKSTKSLDFLTKQLINLNHNLSKMTKPSSEKKDFVRREDPFKKMIKSVDDVEGILRKILDNQKQKSKGLGIGLAGLAIGLGGLLGYLLTGKKEMLFSVIKSLTKYSPFKLILDGIDFAIKKAFPKMFSSLGKLFGRVTKPITEIGAKVMKPITGIFKGISNIFAPLGKLFGGAVAKEGAKAGVKGVGKAFLKKIPVVGALLGLFFGIQRFKKGDTLGGMLEIASGISSIVPVVGTAISIGIDAFLLFRDFKDVMNPNKENIAPKPPTDLTKIPVIGPVIKMVDAFGKFLKDPLGAITDVAGVMENILPGSGQVVMNTVGWIKGLMDKIPEPIKKMGTVAKQALTDPKQFAKNVLNKVGGKIEGVADNAVSSSEQFRKSTAGGSESYSVNSKDFSQSPISSNIGSNIKVTDLKSLKESIKQNEGLELQAYEDADGYSVGYGHFLGSGSSGSGTTISKEQADSLFEKDFSIAHKTASSIPNFNVAPFSAQAALVDMAYNMGGPRLSKFKNSLSAFSSGDYAKTASGVQNSLYARQVPKRASQNIQRLLDASKSGGIISPIGNISQPNASGNLPQSQIGSVLPPSDAVNKVSLSEQTIQSLASAMGTSFKGAVPSKRSNIVSVDTSMRG